MTTDVKIQVIVQAIGIIVSLITSVVAIIISIKTLKQNSKMIEESTRPYITMYYDYTDFGEVFEFLVIKNFGQTSAVITDFKCDFDLKLISDSEGIKKAGTTVFQHIKGTSLAPGQALKSYIDAKSIPLKEMPDFITFTIEYCTENKKYVENIDISLYSLCDTPSVRFNAKNHDKAISYALQDIAGRML